MFDVVKAFNSVVQRFKKDDVVTDAHDLTPHSADSLEKAGYLKAQRVEPPALPKDEPKAFPT